LSHRRAHRGIGARKELTEFSVRKLSVSISVDASDDREQLTFGSIVGAAPQELAEVIRVDTAVVVLVNGTESSKLRKIVAHFQIAFKDFKAARQVDLLVQDVEHRVLDVPRQLVKAATAE